MEKSKVFLHDLGAIEKKVAVTQPRVTHRVDMVYYQDIVNGLTLSMDILLPEGDAIKPAILFLPGGGFTTADYHKTLPLRLYLAQKGYLVASAGYRPIPEQFPTLVHDAKHALAFLTKQADALNIDPKKMIVMGDSAGGYLTQLLTVTAGTTTLLPEGIDQHDTHVTVAVSLYGFSNLLKMTNLTQFQPGTIFSNQDTLSPEKILLKGASADKSKAYTAEELYELAKQASPLHYVTPTSQFSPILLLHGDHDQLVPMAQSTEMFAKLKESDTLVEYWVIDQADHGSVEFSQWTLFEDIHQWLQYQLSKGELK